MIELWAYLLVRRHRRSLVSVRQPPDFAREGVLEVQGLRKPGSEGVARLELISRRRIVAEELS
jgi:hypothetical protein